MGVLAAIHPPETTTAILAYLGLPTRAPPTESALIEPESTDLSASDRWSSPGHLKKPAPQQWRAE
jgi:hypothetical protein